MPILRIVTDIDVSELPGDDAIDQVAESVRQYANGAMPERYLEENDKSSRSWAHIHESNPSYSCGRCRNHANDELS